MLREKGFGASPLTLPDSSEYVRMQQKQYQIHENYFSKLHSMILRTLSGCQIDPIEVPNQIKKHA